MKKRYEFKMDQTALSSERIAKHKDFAALMNKFDQEPEQVAPSGGAAIRSLAPWIATAAAVILLLVIFRPVANVGIEGAPARELAYFASQPFVDPPLKQIQPQYITNAISGTEGGIINYENGSRITVPANAFVTEDGIAVTGNVEIKYREMHDFVDFFLSGIPMYYDSANTRYQLESAGMMEVFAEQNGKQVRLHSDKKLDIELVSHVLTAEMEKPPSFNIYKLNEEKRTWEYRQIDNLSFLDKPAAQPIINGNPKEYLLAQKKSALTNLEYDIQKEIDEYAQSLPKLEKPVKPQLTNGGGKFVFEMPLEDQDIDWNSIITPEMNLTQEDEQKLRESYKSSLWQIAPGTEINKKLLKEVTWDGAKLRHLRDRQYEMVLSKDEASLKLTVVRILTPEDYDIELGVYQNALADYEGNKSERENLLLQKRDAIEEKFSARRQDIVEEYDNKIASFEKGGEAAIKPEAVRRKVVSKFVVPELGIWNCDRPLLPLGRTVKASFAAAGFESGTGYVVNRSKNTVYKFFAYDGCKLPEFENNEDHMLWVVDDNDKLALYKPDAVASQSNDIEFDLQAVNVHSEQDVRQVLSF